MPLFGNGRVLARLVLASNDVVVVQEVILDFDKPNLVQGVARGLKQSPSLVVVQ